MPYKDPNKEKQQKQQYYQDHKQEIIAKNEIWRKANEDRVRAYQAHYWVKDRAKRIEKQKFNRQTKRQLINEIKTSKPCSDCNKFYPYYVMDFDHIIGKKLCNVSSMSSKLNSTIKNLLSEIAKCELVCANCHRQRTYIRSQHLPK